MRNNYDPKFKEIPLKRTGQKRNFFESILIVCEGEKTEKNYFESFRIIERIQSVKIEVVGAGCNTVSVVKKAKELSEEAKQYNSEFDQVWCVFDRDTFPAQHFNSALSLAKNYNFKVAYSNEAFELWYLLHFNYYNTEIRRSSYCRMLSKLLCCKYTKDKIDMYDLLLNRQTTAIHNAKTLINLYNPHNPESDNPCTTVFKLVEELNKNKRQED